MKPTNVCSYIHFYSEHHEKVKLSVFSSMFLRALRICSPEYLDQEVQNIYDIAKRLKYPKHIIDKSFNNAKKTFYGSQIKVPFCKENMLVLPYNNNFIHLPHLLQYFGINVVFKNDSTIKNILIKNSPIISTGCVYTVPCMNCDKKYIGQTGKELSIRLQQHKYSVRTAQNSSAIFVHLNHFNHQIDWHNSDKILNCSDFVKRYII